MGILLTNEERRPYLAYDGTYSSDLNKLLKAQLKKVVEWGGQHCLEHHTRMNNVLHRTCNECWQALFKEAGLNKENKNE